MSPTSSPASLRPNLCTNEHSSHGSVAFSRAIRSAPLVVRTMASLTPRNTLSICWSSSVRSVMITTRASVMFSRSHLVSHTMVRLLPLPWVCQMMPPSRRRAAAWAAFTPKYWLGRHSFFTPASNTMKSWISSRKRALPQSCVTARSSGLAIGLSSFHVR